MNIALMAARRRGVAQYSDTFTRADAAALGGRWVTAGSWAISTNKAVGTPTLGADLIVNGGFDSDTAWDKDADWTISGGAAHAAGALAGTSIRTHTGPLTVGRWYTVTFTILNRTAGNVSSYIGGSYQNPGHVANGTFTDTGRCQGNGVVYVGANNTVTEDIDNVTAQQITLASMLAGVTFRGSNLDVSAGVTRQAGCQAGVLLNCDSLTNPQNLAVAYCDGQGNVKLDKCVGGVWTQVASNAVTYGANKVVRCKKVDTTYTVYYDGVQLGGTTYTIADASVVGNRIAGVFTTTALNSFVNFSAVPAS